MLQESLIKEVLHLFHSQVSVPFSQDMDIHKQNECYSPNFFKGFQSSHVHECDVYLSSTARVSVYCIVIPVVSCNTDAKKRVKLPKTAIPVVPHDADWMAHYALFLMWEIIIST